MIPGMGLVGSSASPIGVRTIGRARIILIVVSCLPGMPPQIPRSVSLIVPGNACRPAPRAIRECWGDQNDEPHLLG